MEPAHRAALPAAIDDLRDRLTRWRTLSTKRRPIPEDLWGEAARLARVHGVSQIATALRLGYYALKERAEGLREECAVMKRPAFVQIDSQPPVFPPSFAMEVERTDGVKMTIRLSGAAPPDLTALVDSFLRERR